MKKRNIYQILQAKGMSRGFALITVLGVLSVMVFLGLLFANLMISELKIAQSQTHSVEGYYASEGALNLAMWKVRKNVIIGEGPDHWGDLFKNGISQEMTIVDYTEVPFILPNLTGKVIIAPEVAGNPQPGKAQLSATGWAKAGEAQAQRIVKVKAVQGTNPNPDDPDPLKSAPMFMGGDITVSSTQMTIQDGGLYCGDDLLVRWGSNINAGGPEGNQAAIANSEICVKNWPIDRSYLQAQYRQCSDYTCPNGDNVVCDTPPVPPYQIPMIDFDTNYPTCGTPPSYKCQAATSPNHIYSQTEFSDLLKNSSASGNQPLIINDITYVTGNIDVKYNQYLKVNGLLVLDGKFMTHVLSKLEVAHTTDQPSGILAKDQVTFQGVLGSVIDIKGMVYSLSSINVQFVASLSNQSFHLEGGIVGNNIDILTIFNRDDIVITYNPEWINDILHPDPVGSPVVSVEHWEEEY